MEFNRTFSIIDTTAEFYITPSLVDLALNNSCLPKDYIPTVFHLEFRRFRFDNRTDVVDDQPLFLSFPMAEACRPSFECFEAKGERILSWRKPITLIHQHFIFSEGISGFIVVHFVAGTMHSYILRPMIVICIILFLDFRYLRKLLKIK